MRIFSVFYVLCVMFFLGVLTGRVASSSWLEEDMYPLLFSENFEDNDTRGWRPNFPANWEIREEDGSLVYTLLAPGDPGRIRAPYSWSILEDYDVKGFVFRGKLKCNEDVDNPYRDVVIVFNFQDPEHFYYVHFSAISDEVHNIIALVDGKDRVKINFEAPGESKARLTDDNFHDFKVTYNATNGEIRAYLDDMDTPILTALDRTLAHGAVGVGSFDDIAGFDDIRLWGNIYKE